MTANDAAALDKVLRRVCCVAVARAGTLAQRLSLFAHLLRSRTRRDIESAELLRCCAMCGCGELAPTDDVGMVYDFIVYEGGEEQLRLTTSLAQLEARRDAVAADLARAPAAGAGAGEGEGGGAAAVAQIKLSDLTEEDLASVREQLGEEAVTALLRDLSTGSAASSALLMERDGVDEAVRRTEAALAAVRDEGRRRLADAKALRGAEKRGGGGGDGAKESVVKMGAPGAASAEVREAYGKRLEAWMAGKIREYDQDANFRRKRDASYRNRAGYVAFLRNKALERMAKEFS